MSNKHVIYGQNWEKSSLSDSFSGQRETRHFKSKWKIVIFLMGQRTIKM